MQRPHSPVHVHTYIHNKQYIEPQVAAVNRTVYFYFFVNRGSGGRLGPVLLDMGVDEISLDNFMDRRAFPNLDRVKVKICPLNDADMRTFRMQELSILSKTHQCSILFNCSQYH